MFWINYRDAAGRRHREKIGTKVQALELLRLREADGADRPDLPTRFATPWMRERVREAPNGSRCTLEELVRAFSRQRQQRITPLNWNAEQYRLEKLLELLGPQKHVASIDAGAIEDVLLRLREQRGVSNATANRYRSAISAMFRFAVLTGRRAANPAAGVRKFKEDPLGRLRYLSEEEEARLRAAIQEHDARRIPEFDLALNTGLRRSEQFNLRWIDVDLKAGILQVIGKGGRRRVIPLNSRARVALRALHEMKGLGPWVVKHLSHRPQPGTGPKQSLGQRDNRRWFEICVKQAGIEDFVWHDLRHTFATRLVQAGVDIITVQRLLGHTSILMTMRYAHARPDFELEAVERLVKQEN